MRQCRLFLLAVLLLSSAAVGQGFPRVVAPAVIVPAVPLEKGDKPVENDNFPVLYWMCTDVLQKMEDAFLNEALQKDVEDVVAVVKGLCSLLPFEEKMKCQMAVELFGPRFFKLVLKHLDSRSFCREITLCSDAGKLPMDLAVVRKRPQLLSRPARPGRWVAPAPPESSRSCEVCLFFWNSVLSVVTSNRTEEIVNGVVDRLCLLAPKGMQAQCYAFLHEYGPMVVRMTANQYIRPRQICEAHKECPAGFSRGEVPVSAPAPTVPVKIRDDGSVSTGDILLCLLCIDVVQQAKQAIKDPSLQKDTQNGLENGLCSMFPDEEGPKCRAKVKIYGPLVFQVVANNLDPKIFCQDITLCDDAPVPPPLKLSAVSAIFLSSFHLSKAQEGRRGVACEICLSLVKEVVDMLTSSRTEDEVIGVVDKICLALPSGLEKRCYSLLRDVLTIVIKMTVDELIQPLQICTYLSFCSEGNKLLSGGTTRLLVT